MSKKNVVAVNWTEYERGWGSRPDGHTLHLTFEDAKRYIEKYWDDQPDRLRAPDDYSVPGTPKTVEVDAQTFQNIVNSNGTIWGHPTKWI